MADDPDLRRLLALVQARLSAGDSPSPTVQQLCVQYQASPEFLALRSRSDEEGRIRKHISRLLGHVRASELTLVHLDDYRQTRSKESGCRKGQLTKPATRNREVVRLVRIVNWAVDRKLLKENPIAKAPLEPEENTRRTSIEASQVESLESACSEYKAELRINLTLWAMVATKFDSGLRRRELCLLRKSQLHMRDGAIELHELDTKGRKGRVTLLSERAADAIRAMPRDVRFAESPFVFLTTRGKPYHPRTFLRMFQEVAALAGIKAADGENVWGHDLRAGFVGQQLELGTPEREIMDMGGWTTREVFDRYHRRRGSGAVARAKARLDAFVRMGPKRSDNDVVAAEHQKKTHST